MTKTPIYKPWEAPHQNGQQCFLAFCEYMRNEVHEHIHDMHDNESQTGFLDGHEGLAKKLAKISDLLSDCITECTPK